MDFEAELAKFQPSLEIEQVEDAIYGNRTTDVTDLIQTILNNKTAGNEDVVNRTIEWVEES